MKQTDLLLYSALFFSGFGVSSAVWIACGLLREDQIPYLDAVVETRLRFSLGIPLILLGMWLVDYCDRTFKGDIGWRGWLLWSTTVGCWIASAVLLLFRRSLAELL